MITSYKYDFVYEVQGNSTTEEVIRNMSIKVSIVILVDKAIACNTNMSFEFQWHVGVA